MNDRGSLPAAVMQAYLQAHPSTAPAAPEPTAPAAPEAAAAAAPEPATAPAAPAVPAQPTALAGELRGFLDAMDGEVRAVTALSERIDGLVTELNALRDEQAGRLLVLDALQAEAVDADLRAFLTKSIKPRKPQVREVVPERLR